MKPRTWQRPYSIECNARIKPAINRERVIAYLRGGKKLTTSLAVTELGIYGLPRVISELRQIGHPIRSNRVATVNSLGDRVTVCEYSLPIGKGERVWNRTNHNHTRRS